MKNLLLACAALLAVTAMVAANLWRNLHAERLANAELSTELAAARAAPPVPAPVAPSVAVAPPVAAGAPVAAPVPAPAPLDNVLSSQAVSAAFIANTVSAIGGVGEHELLKDPEYRQAQLTVARIKLAQSNPGLAEALGLSAAEARHLFEVMAEQQLQRTAELSAATAASGGAVPNVADLLRRASGDDPVRAELGEARYAQYQDYQRNVRPALQQAASIGSTLSAAGQSMTAAQSSALTRVMLAEQQRQLEEAAMPRANPNPGAPVGVAYSLEQSYARQEESNRRVLEASASNLTPAQLDVLRQQFEKQAASRRRTIEAARELDARRTQTPTGAER
jgi:hypothetical protein